MRVVRGFARGSPGVSSGFLVRGCSQCIRGIGRGLRFLFLGETVEGFICGPKVPGLREGDEPGSSLVFGGL